MTTNDLLEALARLRVETGSLACLGCGHEHNCSTHGCAILRAAADLIERLTAEVADLRKELEWKDMVIALAQRKQVEAEEERDALREKQRWIPVTERMPELEVPVLVLDRRGNMIVRTLRRLVSDKEAVFRPDGLAPRKNITHWMPLPKAPEDGDT